MGLEMLGAVGEAQVQQAVCLAARSLDALGAEWVLEVSHMGYLFGLFDALGVPDAARAKLLEKLREKNAHELRAAAGAAGLADAAADILCSVLSLCGSYAETMEKAAALCKNDAMCAAVAELEALAVPLEKAGGVIRLDMTLAGEMEYYNGLVFQGYLKALPRPLCQARPVPPRLTRLPVARSRSRGAFLFARRVVCCIQNAALHDFERRKRTWRSGKRSASFALPEI